MILKLVRKLKRTRNDLQHAKAREYWLFNEARDTHQGLLVFARDTPNTSAYGLVALNFSDSGCKPKPIEEVANGRYPERAQNSGQPFVKDWMA